MKTVVLCVLLVSLLVLSTPNASPMSSRSNKKHLNNHRTHSHSGPVDIRSTIKANDLIAVSIIIEQGWNINRLDSHGYTLLIYAVRFNQIQIVRYLLDKGANPSTTDASGAIALLYTRKDSLAHHILSLAMTNEALKEFPAKQAAYNVVYSVSGSAETASVTYSTGDGSTQQENNISLPWEKKMMASPGAFLYISAQNDSDSGDIYVEIEVKGDFRKSARSDGAYAIASTQDTF